MDLVILIFLVVRFVKYAKANGQNGWRWGLYLVLNWFMFELLGVALVTHFLNIKLDMEFMQGNPAYATMISIFGIGCGFLGYFLTKKRLDRFIAR